MLISIHEVFLGWVYWMVLVQRMQNSDDLTLYYCYSVLFNAQVEERCSRQLSFIEIFREDVLSAVKLSPFKNKGCSESNSSYFIVLAHHIRGRLWWCGNEECIFPPTFHYILLPCDGWQQRGSLTKWHLTWNCVWNKGVQLISSMQKKLHPLTFTDTFWTFMKTKQWMWVQWDSSMWKTNHVPYGQAQMSCQKINNVFISSSMWIDGL